MTNNFKYLKIVIIFLGKYFWKKRKGEKVHEKT